MEFIIRRTSDCRSVGPKPIESAILKEFFYKGGKVVVDRDPFWYCDFSIYDTEEEIFFDIEKMEIPNAPLKGYAWVIEVNNPLELLVIIEKTKDLKESRGFLKIEFSESYQMPLIEIVDDYLD